MSLFPEAKRQNTESLGDCPRCKSPVREGAKGFFCDGGTCGFMMWKDNKFFSSKKKTLDRKTAAALLTEGRVFISGLFSEKTGRTYDATVVLEDTGGKFVNFKLEFAKGGK
jgi:DNA topoisomerase-3